MSAQTLIRNMVAAGVQLTLSESGAIKATGEDALVNRWLPTIREHRAEIIDALQLMADDESTSLVMPDADEQRILAWLDHIGESDPVTIGEVIDRCRSDASARRYFIDRAQADDLGVTGTVRHRGQPEAEAICRLGPTPARPDICRRKAGD